jgi:hypothetical protein
MGKGGRGRKRRTARVKTTRRRSTRGGEEKMEGECKEEVNEDGGERDENKYEVEQGEGQDEEQQQAMCKLLKQLFTQYLHKAIIFTMLALSSDTVYQQLTACTSHRDCENNNPLFCKHTEQQRLLCYNS